MDVSEVGGGKIETITDKICTYAFYHTHIHQSNLGFIYPSVIIYKFIFVERM